MGKNEFLDLPIRKRLKFAVFGDLRVWLKIFSLGWHKVVGTNPLLIIDLYPVHKWG